MQLQSLSQNIFCGQTLLSVFKLCLFKLPQHSPNMCIHIMHEAGCLIHCAELAQGFCMPPTHLHSCAHTPHTCMQLMQMHFFPARLRTCSFEFGFYIPILARAPNEPHAWDASTTLQPIKFGRHPLALMCTDTHNSGLNGFRLQVYI